MDQIKLPRFPPRKARKTPALIKFVVRWFDKFQILSNPIPTSSTFDMKSRLKLLILSAIDRTSISRKARDLRDQNISIPSGETTLAWLKTNTVDQITGTQQIGFFQFLNSLPENFQRARKRGMILAIDFHLDPNYAKTTSSYIRNGKPKASTSQFYQFFSVIWVNAPEPITLGVQLIPKKYSTLHRFQDLLSPLLAQEKVIGILGDGDFYNYDLVEWLLDKQVFFIIRARVNSGVKPLVQKYKDELLCNGDTKITDYNMNKGHTRKKIPVKLVLANECDKIFAYIVPPTCKLAGKALTS
ncbi:MAG: hypothetical protein EAX86_00005, partial [Candidatus Heimdallarchaeota archaeon]|nr:hypothetical protein [Candidatus Heimdallarchaeota archaeon]